MIGGGIDTGTRIVGPDVDFLAIGPVLALAVAALVVILVRAILRKRGPVNQISLGVGLAGVAAAGVLLGIQWNEVRDDGTITTIAGAVRLDTFGVFLGVVVLAATAMSLFLAASYLEREELEAPEYYALMLLSAAGMLTMTTANDLIVVFVALELLSIPLYVLAAFDRRRLSSQESGIKYFVLGAFSSAVFLYGIALTYGATGTTSLTGIADFLSANTLFEQGTLLAGLALLLVGLGFKVAAVPFHMWTPDVYQGAPTPVTAFMSSATKAAGFAALLRLLGVAFPLYRTDWRPAILGLAVLSLAVGSIAAVIQTDVKRILAYSSIAHAGYILIGLQVDTARGRQASLFYLLVYAFMTVGAFAVITVATRKGDDKHSLDDYRGLALRRPVVGGLLGFFVLAQAGVPLTGGFVVKLEIFSSAVDAGEYGLAIVGVLAAVVAAFIYLRIAVALFTSPGGEAADASEDRPVDRWTAAVLAVTTAAVLFAGILPGAWLTFAKDATFL
ncbi:MAG: NADH-quinone oxidoreductase subunit N [Actinobacteria bacterium]|nr:NADH-quinone oxidoreductase subunit N [Actinomycetota bacterium]